MEDTAESAIDVEYRRKEMSKIQNKYTKEDLSLFRMVNDDTILFSLLYDLNLLPEQCKQGTMQYLKMMIILEHWKLLKRDVHTDEKISSSSNATNTK